MFFCLLMQPRPPRSTLTDTLVPTRRSSHLLAEAAGEVAVEPVGAPDQEQHPSRGPAVVGAEEEVHEDGQGAEPDHRGRVGEREDAGLEDLVVEDRSAEHTSALQSLMRI